MSVEEKQAKIVTQVREMMKVGGERAYRLGFDACKIMVAEMLTTRGQPNDALAVLNMVPHEHDIARLRGEEQ